MTCRHQRRRSTPETAGHGSELRTPGPRQSSHPFLGAVAAFLVTVISAILLATAPASAADHVVREGETLTAIARRYGVPLAELARHNQLLDPNHLLVGARLHLPSTAGKAPALSQAAPTSSGGTRLSEQGPMFSLDENQRRLTDRLLAQAAREFSVPSSLLKALTYTESRWRQDAVSSTGAVGVGQLLPSTATWLSGIMDEPELDLRSTQDNVRMSARLLRYLLDATGSTRSALAAYYQGVGAVRRTGVSPGGASYAAVITNRQAWFG